MSISNKIKALLNLYGKDHGDLATFLGFSNRQSLSNKFHRGSFSAEDLIKIAVFLGCDLAFIVDDKTKVVLDQGDIKAKESEQ